MNNSDTPIVKIFEPDPVQLEEPAEIQSKHIRTELLDNNVRERLNRTLNEYDARALVITPNYNRYRIEDVGAQLVCYFLPGDRQWSALTRIRLCNAVQEALGAAYMLAYPFNRESEEYWGKHFRLRDPIENPIRQVFQELDKRDASPSRSDEW
jgi:hypothetical protein